MCSLKVKPADEAGCGTLSAHPAYNSAISSHGWHGCNVMTSATLLCGASNHLKLKIKGLNLTCCHGQAMLDNPLVALCSSDVAEVGQAAYFLPEIYLAARAYR